MRTVHFQKLRVKDFNCCCCFLLILGGGGGGGGGGAVGVYVFEEHCNTENFFYSGKIYREEILLKLWQILKQVSLCFGSI